MHEEEGVTRSSQESGLPVVNHPPSSVSSACHNLDDISIPAAPPTTPGFIPQVRPNSTWPGMIGIIALVIGIVALIFNLWGIVGPVFFRRFVINSTPINQQLLNGSTVAMSISIAAGKSAMAIFLLFVGARFLQRHPRSRVLAIRYSLLQIMVTIVATIFAIMIQYPLMQKAASSMNTGGTAVLPSGAMTQPVFIFGVVVGFFMSCAFPIFLLIWFNRQTIQREVTNWKSRQTL